jgi:hypothetical protein
MDIIDLNVRDSEIEDLRAEVASLKQQAILRDLEIVRLREALSELANGNARVIATADMCDHKNYGYEACEACLQEYAEKALSTPIDLSALARHAEEIVGLWRKDALRYIWLRDVGDSTWNPISKRGITAKECDIAIDSAIDATKWEKE